MITSIIVWVLILIVAGGRPINNMPVWPLVITTFADWYLFFKLVNMVIA